MNDLHRPHFVQYQRAISPYRTRSVGPPSLSFGRETCARCKLHPTYVPTTVEFGYANFVSQYTSIFIDLLEFINKVCHFLPNSSLTDVASWFHPLQSCPLSFPHNRATFSPTRSRCLAPPCPARCLQASYPPPVQVPWFRVRSTRESRVHYFLHT